jgi:hypothetical protein
MCGTWRGSRRYASFLVCAILQLKSHLTQKMDLRVDRLTPSRIEFDLIGIDASIANALRRICIAEVSLGRAVERFVIWS